MLQLTKGQRNGRYGAYAVPSELLDEKFLTS